MKQRSIPMCVVLTIVTCGIYGIFWFIMLTNETNTVAHRPMDTSGGNSFLFTILTCGIYGIYWAYRMGEKVEAVRAERGEGAANLPILYLILNLIGFSIITYALIQSELNKVLPVE